MVTKCWLSCNVSPLQQEVAYALATVRNIHRPSWPSTVYTCIMLIHWDKYTDCVSLCANIICVYMHYICACALYAKYACITLIGNGVWNMGLWTGEFVQQQHYNTLLPQYTSNLPPYTLQIYKLYVIKTKAHSRITPCLVWKLRSTTTSKGLEDISDLIYPVSAMLLVG